jgi:very-short-patch-repair endonuclease
MDKTVDSQEATSAREKILRVFNYLKALNEYRNPATREIDEHTWSFWLDDLPDHPAIERLLRRKPVSDEATGTADQGDASVILRVQRPKLTQCPTPPKSLVQWLHRGWEKPEEVNVRWIESLNETNRDGETVIVRFDDDKERVEAQAEWTAIRQEWRANELPARKAMQVFDQMYELHGRIERESERLDLVVGDGLLSWQRDDGNIFHPLLIQRVQLLFDPKLPEFTVVDADFGLELYTAIFESSADVDPRALSKCRDELFNTALHPLDEEASGYLKRLALTLSSKGELVTSHRPASGQEHPVIGRSPVLYLRSRSIGLTNAIDQTIRKIGQRDIFCDALEQIVGIRKTPSFDEDFSDSNSSPAASKIHASAKKAENSILFGKKSNAEQMKIAQRLDQHGAVLVQGPPGTGKSHTIANLIGHLLAQGKSVLVTSHTTKALKVLREHVVPDLRPLCVSVLDSDETSRRQLEESVAAINARLSDSDAATLLREAEEFAVQRDLLLDARQKLIDSLSLARANEYREIVLAGVSVSPSEAAREVRKGCGIHDWIPGPVWPGAPLPLSSQEIAELYGTNTTTNDRDDENSTLSFPSPDAVMKPQDFASCVSFIDTSAHQPLYQSSREFWGETKFTANHIREISTLSDLLSANIAEFKSMQLWQIAAIDAGRDGGSEKAAWDLLKSEIVKTVALAADCRLDVLQHAPKVDEVLSIAEQLNIAEQVVQHTSNGGKISRWTALTNRAWKEMLAKWSVRAGVPSSPEHYVVICKLLRLKAARETLQVLWDDIMLKNGSRAFAELGDAPEHYCEQFIAGINTALGYWEAKWGRLLNELTSMGFAWEAFLAQAAPIEGKFGALKRIVSTVETRLVPLLRSTAATLSSLSQQNRLRAVSSHLATSNIPEVMSLRHALVNKDVRGYEDAFHTMLEAVSRQKQAIRRKELLSKLASTHANGQSVASNWAKAIRHRDGVHGKSSPPGDIAAAWRWRQLHDEIQRRNETDIDQLQAQIESLSSEIDRVAVSLIERKAWSTQVKNAGAFQQDLVGWLDIVRRIGKGYGKRVSRLQSEARLKMRNCRAAVPVWIMPIARLVDNFDFSKTQFDVVIIDEASQCDVMGLLAIALAKQVVVVGDHEQVSPSSVGQDAAKIDNLIRHHLEGIPNSVLYDGKISIYDLARQSFGGLICLLEHFRCTTDIIQFSNYLSYNGTIKPLRDDARFSAQVIEYRVESAESNRKKINSVEATAITSLIVAATEFPEYDGMTFGVISLVGDDQALEIEKQLRLRLPAEVFDARRVACGNSAQFQGDERDVMFLSVIDTPSGGPLRLKQDAATQQRYNVAASRARNQMWVVHSLNTSTDLQAGDLRKRLIDHARDPKAITREIEKAEAQAESPFEEAVIKRLVTAKFNVRPQRKVGRYRIDIVVHDGVRRLAVECDGDRYHGPEKLADDMNRQAILERLGWKFHRIRGTEFFRDPDSAMNRLFSRLSELNIEPSADVAPQSVEEDSETLTQRLIRRAAEVRRSWEAGDDSLEADLIAFKPKVKQALKASEVVGNDAESEPTNVPELDKFSFVQGQLNFDASENAQPPGKAIALEYLDRTETQIIRLLQSQPGLEAKQIAGRLNMQEKDVIRILRENLKDYVKCDSSKYWQVSAG